MAAIVRDSNGRMVRLWRVNRYAELPDGEGQEELPPDLTLNVDQMNALVVEWLRGPMGPAGPTGAMGIAGLPGTTTIRE